MKSFFLYLTRWQLSTLILAPCISIFSQFGTIWSAIIANLIGGCVFYFVDKQIFKKQ